MGMKTSIHTCEIAFGAVGKHVLYVCVHLISNKIARHVYGFSVAIKRNWFLWITRGRWRKTYTGHIPENLGQRKNEKENIADFIARLPWDTVLQVKLTQSKGTFKPFGKRILSFPGTINSQLFNTITNYLCITQTIGPLLGSHSETETLAIKWTFSTDFLLFHSSLIPPSCNT